jgi:hypothetical protein
MIRIVCAIAVAGWALAAHADSLRIGTITVRTEPVFDVKQGDAGSFYRVTNLFHVQTRESLVRSFLLFREGDLFDAAKLDETERNLRALDFIESVDVTIGDPHDGIVDVTVTTTDAWTTDINADFSDDGGRSLYDFDVTQKDLFFRGAAAGVRFQNGRDRRTASVELLHPALFGPYWSGDALYAHSSDGNEETLTIERPLFSYATANTVRVSFDHLLQDSRVYQFASIASLFRQEHRETTVALGHAISRRPTMTARLLVGADLVSDRFTAIRGVPPGNRQFRFLEIGVDALGFNFVKVDHVDFGVREQDFNLGLHASLVGGISVVSRDQRRTVFRLRSENSVGRMLGGRSFVLSTLAATTRLHTVNRNAIVSSDTRVVARWPSKYPHTFVSRLRLDLGRDLDRDVQFLADGQNGLRAYPNFAFEGTRRIVFNAEDRLFLGRELLQIFEPGAAVFIDSGAAVSDKPLRARDFRTDIGGGLRLFIARYDSAVIRIDAAYALNDSPISRRGLIISISTAQAF